MGQALIAIGLLCQVHVGSPSYAVKAQKECQYKLAKCTWDSNAPSETALLQCLKDKKGE